MTSGSSSPTLAVWLAEAARAAYPELAANGAPLAEPVARRTLPYSVIEEWRVGRADRERRFILKRSNYFLDRERGEFETLTELWAAFRSRSGLAVPRPIGFRGDARLLAMEKVPGVQLRALLPLFPLAHSNRVREAVRGCGAWLAVLHDATESKHPRREALDRLLEDLERSTDACRRSGLAPALLRAAVGYVRRAAPAALDRGPLVGCHTDFSPSNILVSDGGVAVIDFTDYRIGSPYQDLGYFMGMLERDLGVRFQRDLHVRLLDGYRRRRPIDAEALHCFRVAQRLRIAQWNRQRPTRPWSLLGLLFWRADLAALTRWLRANVPRS